MKDISFRVIHNRPLVPGSIYELRLQGDTTDITKPGQFVNLLIEGFYLRRPISVCDWDEGSLTLLYKVVGEGTKKLAAYVAGQEIAVLVGLGNGYDISRAGEKPVLIGGGVGIPPLYGLAKRLCDAGVSPTVIVGFRTKDEAFYLEEFAAVSSALHVTTEDGSYGQKGYVTDALRSENPSHIFTCGPEGMLHAIYRESHCGGSYSFEERMGCGFGACMGCSCETIAGYIRICKEGPVLQKEEIKWKD